MSLVGNDPKDLDRRNKLAVLYKGDLFYFLADPPVVLLVALLVLVKVLFIRGEPEASGRSVLELVKPLP